MSSIIQDTLRTLIETHSAELTATLRVKGCNDRVDALTILCRTLLRDSTLCLIGGIPHIFDGVLYSPVKLPSVQSSLANALMDAGVSPTDVRRMGDMPLSVISEKSFPAPKLLCFSNGVLDLGEGEFHEGFSPSVIATEHLPYPYNPAAGCPLWDGFLAEVLPDAPTRLVLQEFAGLCYIDRKTLSIEKFAVLLGSGANGKSVIREVLSAVFGVENVCGYDADQLTRPELTPYLIGKRINFASDMRADAAFDSALKALASGQDVVGRKIYGEPVTVNCPPIVFSMNTLPRFKDTSPAFFRRLLLFEFGVVIPEERRDRHLAGRIISAELPGVLNWVLEGRSRLLAQRGAFTPAPQMDNALERVIPRDKSRVQEWLDASGYSTKPFKGCVREPVPFYRITLEVGTGITPNAIARELKSLGAEKVRSKGISYIFYSKPSDK